MTVMKLKEGTIFTEHDAAVFLRSTLTANGIDPAACEVLPASMQAKFEPAQEGHAGAELSGDEEPASEPTSEPTAEQE